MEFTCEDCSVKDVLTECLELLGPDMEHRGVKGRLNLDSSLSPVYVDKDILAQIFTGLLLNAVKEMNAGDTLYIRTFESRRNVNIEFKNRGPKTKGTGMDRVLIFWRRLSRDSSSAFQQIPQTDGRFPVIFPGT